MKTITITPSLATLCELSINTAECTALKVKSNSEMSLIAIGRFTGLETMFRLTSEKDESVLTVWRSDGKISTWTWPKTSSKYPDNRAKLTDGARDMINTILRAMEDLK